MNRFLVLFAREPARQARDKGLASREGTELFRGFARGWLDAARHAGARLIVAAPPEDRPAWNQVFSGAADRDWITQHGSSLGARLEDAARRAAALGGHAVLVGGDVTPSSAAVLEAFEAIETTADAVVSPAPDGGISLLALAPEDLDLLRGVRERRRTVLRDLLRGLSQRRRAVALLCPAADVDGRRSLRTLLRRFAIPVALHSRVREVLRVRVTGGGLVVLPPRPRALSSPSGLRAPPARRAA